MLEILGLIGGLLFGCACVPMAYRAWKDGDSGTTPVSAMWLFLSACVTYFGYLFLAFGFHFAFCIGIIETACWLIVIRYRYWPRFDFKSICTRPPHAVGPCNGLPRDDCPVWSDPLDPEYTDADLNAPSRSDFDYTANTEQEI